MQATQAPTVVWYKLVNVEDDIQQGEIISNFPLIAPSTELTDDVSKIDNVELLTQDDDMLISLQRNDVVVLTQSCDIENNKVRMITVCPVDQLTALKSKYLQQQKKTEESFRSWVNAIIDGKNKSYFALNSCDFPEVKREVSIIDVSSPFTFPIKYVRSVSKRRQDRIRLVSPFRESMSVFYSSTLARVAIEDRDQIRKI